MLRIVGVSKTFGGVNALRDVSIAYSGVGTLGLIGPNGSGKSTLINVLSGLCVADKGQVLLFGEAIEGRAAAAISRLGLRRSFQEAMVFPGLTVRENLLMACKYAKPGSFAPTFALDAEMPEDVVDAISVLLGIDRALDSRAGSLSYGELKKIGIGMALAGPCKVLLLDEPAAGLNRGEVDELSALLKKLDEADLPLVVVDHNMSFLANICAKMVVLDQGEVIADGLSSEVMQDPKVISVYLGEAP